MLFRNQNTLVKFLRVSRERTKSIKTSRVLFQLLTLPNFCGKMNEEKLSEIFFFLLGLLNQINQFGNGNGQKELFFYSFKYPVWINFIGKKRSSQQVRDDL